MQIVRPLAAALLRDGVLRRGRSPAGEPMARVGIAVACVAAGALLASASAPWLDGAHFIILLPAVGAATLLSGPLPGLLAVVLAAGAAHLYGGDLQATTTSGLAMFAVIALWDVALISALLAAAQRSQAALARVEVLNSDLQASEARFRDLLEAAPDAIVISDSAERIVLVNAEAERLFGYDRSDLLGRTVDMLMPERFRDHHRGRISGFAAKGGRRRMGDGEAMYGLRRDGSEFPIETNLSRLPGSSEGLVCAVVRDLTIRREHQATQSLLILELNHRVKNTLASVQSIVAQTLRTAANPRVFNEALTARIMALSQSHDVLTRNDWSGAHIADIVAEQLKPYERDGDVAFRLSGPDIQLRPNRAVALGMAVGELCTNAGKFGALSAAGGSVEVVWDRLDKDGVPQLRLIWTERGGPPVKPARRRGFGARMITRSLSTGLHGAARIAFDPAGVVCEMEFPLLESEARTAG